MYEGIRIYRNREDKVLAALPKENLRGRGRIIGHIRGEVINKICKGANSISMMGGSWSQIAILIENGRLTRLIDLLEELNHIEPEEYDHIYELCKHL